MFPNKEMRSCRKGEKSRLSLQQNFFVLPFAEKAPRRRFGKAFVKFYTA
jgi:hypothetical protein